MTRSTAAWGASALAVLMVTAAPLAGTAQSAELNGLSRGSGSSTAAPSPIWTDADNLPETLQDSFSFGEIGPPDLQWRTDAGYQSLLDQAALESAHSERAGPDDYVFVSHDHD